MNNPFQEWLGSNRFKCYFPLYFILIFWRYSLSLPTLLKKHSECSSVPIYLNDLIAGEGKKSEKVDIEKGLQALPPVLSRLWLVHHQKNLHLHAAVAERFKVKIEETVEGAGVL